MVQIIKNPYQPQPNMGDTFKAGISSLAAPFLDPLTPEIKRQHLLAQQQSLHDAQWLQGLKEAGAGAIGSGGEIADPQAAARASFLAGANARGQAQSQLSYNANKYGAMDPRTTNSAVGAGEAYGSTGQGTREAEQTKYNMASLQANKQAEAQIRAAGLQPVEAQDANGNPAWTTHADIASGKAQAAGITPKLTKDFLIAQELAKGLRGGGGAPANVAGPGAPGAPLPPRDPFAGSAPSVRHAAGVGMPPMTFIGAGNRVARSTDGGNWGTLDDGTEVPLNTGGWVQAGPETAVAESRMARMKADAGTAPPAATADPMSGDMAKASYATTGLAPWFKSDLNTLLGTVGVPGEIAPDVQQARQRLSIARQTTKSAFMNSPTSPIKEQNILDEMLPGGPAIGNAETEARKVANIVQYLQQDNTRLRQIVQRSVDPQAMSRAQQALIENEKALSIWVAGAQQPGQAQGGVPVGTPSQADQPTQQPAAAPQAQEQPPMAGAEKAPDGNWYVQKNGQYFRVEQ
jgi:hypothetical protein